MYWQMGIQCSDSVENIVGKEEIARYKQFLLFQQSFQKVFVVHALKWVSMEKRVKTEFIPPSLPLSVSLSLCWLTD